MGWFTPMAFDLEWEGRRCRLPGVRAAPVLQEKESTKSVRILANGHQRKIMPPTKENKEKHCLAWASIEIGLGRGERAGTLIP